MKEYSKLDLMSIAQTTLYAQSNLYLKVMLMSFSPLMWNPATRRSFWFIEKLKKRFPEMNFQSPVDMRQGVWLQIIPRP